jgi:hypothetical protein
MKNYRIHFTEAEREAVLNIISSSNDIVLNQIEPESVFITIQLDDDEADVMYGELLEQIDREVRAPRVVVVVQETIVVDNPGSIEQI